MIKIIVIKRNKKGKNIWHTYHTTAIISNKRKIIKMEENLIKKRIQ